MKPWTPDTDPATIPDDVLKSEWGRRNNAKRKTKGAGPGRPRKATQEELRLSGLKFPEIHPPFNKIVDTGGV